MNNLNIIGDVKYHKVNHCFFAEVLTDLIGLENLSEIFIGWIVFFVY